jgi:hypothetical protein
MCRKRKMMIDVHCSEALYRGRRGADAVQLEEVQRGRLPRAVSAACSPAGAGGNGSENSEKSQDALLSCLFLATTQDEQLKSEMHRF